MLERTEAARVEEELARSILARTGGRLLGLAVEVLPEAVVLRGVTTSWYVKQLAQHSASKLLPRLGVRNAIVVAASA